MCVLVISSFICICVNRYLEKNVLNLFNFAITFASRHKVVLFNNKKDLWKKILKTFKIEKKWVGVPLRQSVDMIWYAESNTISSNKS